ncbi:MAG: glycosyltransferase family 87 protein [Janthinobacterium lividum]
MTGWTRAFRRGDFWTRDRVGGYAAVLLACELLAFVYCSAGAHGFIVPLDRPNASDFVSFYAAGSLADDGDPASAYDQAAHWAREQQVTEPGIAYNFFYYPPVFLFLCAALARLPYLVAFCVFQASCLLACVIAARRITPGVPIATLLAFPAIFWTIGTGQNALLTAALLAVVTLAVDTRPVLAGILMGVLCYKPHLGLLLPVALVAGRHWRAFWAASLSAFGLVAVSVVTFGWTTWGAFLIAARQTGSVYGVADTKVDLAGLTNAYGAALTLWGNPALAIQVQIVMTLCVMGGVAWVWAGQHRLALRAAVLLAGIPIAAPIVMFYDLMVTGLAITWLVRDGHEHGFPPWQKTGLTIAFSLPLLSGNLDATVQSVASPLAAFLVMGLALRATLQDYQVYGARWLPE